MQEIIGSVTSIAVIGLTWKMRESIPDGKPASCFLHAAFHLIRRCRRAPKKTLWEISLCG